MEKTNQKKSQNKKKKNKQKTPQTHMYVQNASIHNS